LDEILDIIVPKVSNYFSFNWATMSWVISGINVYQSHLVPKVYSSHRS
jgi:hypothetical protein